MAIFVKDNFVNLPHCRSNLNLWKAYPSSNCIYVCVEWNLV